MNNDSCKINQVSCICGECKQKGNYYICASCKRLVPWCFGAADKYYDYCDDCAYKLELLSNIGHSGDVKLGSSPIDDTDIS